MQLTKKKFSLQFIKNGIIYKQKILLFTSLCDYLYNLYFQRY